MRKMRMKLVAGLMLASTMGAGSLILMGGSQPAGALEINIQPVLNLLPGLNPLISIQPIIDLPDGL